MRPVNRRPIVPPAPSNYLKRSGRYSRRSDYTERSHYDHTSLDSFNQLCFRRQAEQIRLNPQRRRYLALLIAAHDEALVITKTIESAIAAGLNRRDIYVVDDNSSDATSQIARDLLGPMNVCRVRRSGKGLALTKGAAKFHLSQRYRWIHIADADGGFASDYFKVLRQKLRVSNAAATGYVSSLPGGSVSQFRVFEYTIGMEIHRRFQSMTGTINVIPGPTSCFRHDVFERVDFNNQSLTEDLDVTLQIHRQGLGKIQFIPGAVAYTQDPQSLHDYIRQITRWNRGVMQSMLRHRVGRRLHRLDAYMSYQVLQNIIMLFNYCLILPVFALLRHDISILALTFLIDVALTLWLTLLVAAWTRRYDIVSAFPQIYYYRWVSLIVFVKAFAEVMLLRRFRVNDSAGWETAGRRYVSVQS